MESAFVECVKNKFRLNTTNRVKNKSYIVVIF